MDDNQMQLKVLLPLLRENGGVEVGLDPING